MFACSSLPSRRGARSLVSAYLGQRRREITSDMRANHVGAFREYHRPMARGPRIQLSGFIRHVVARGNGRMRIFLDDVDYTRFLDLLVDVVEEFQVECWSYCVLPNHYHLAIRPTLSNLSDAVKFLNSSYAQWWNKRHETVGHVFQGRFKDQIVDHDEYLLALCRYIALNPVRAGLAAQPQEWRWSSYPATVGLRPVHPALVVSNVLRQFGDADQQTLQARFATFVQSAGNEICTDERIRSREKILGSKTFKSTIEARISPKVEVERPWEVSVVEGRAAI